MTQFESNPAVPTGTAPGMCPGPEGGGPAHAAL